MLAYAMLGTNDLGRAVRFYEPLMALLGQPQHLTADHEVGWGSAEDPHRPGLYIGRPFDGKPAGVANGGMLAFRAPGADAVDRLHAAALAAGGIDEGSPGLRPQYGPRFYAAYVRDPDGNKLAFVCYVTGEAA